MTEKGDEIPIVYVLRNSPSAYLFKTRNYQTAERMCQEYKEFGHSVWVDLETEDGQPHPCLEQG